MTRLRTILWLALCSLAGPWALHAQQMNLEIEALTGEGEVEYDLRTHTFTASKGVLVKYGGAVLTAERVTANELTGEVLADGGVRIERDDQIWVSEHIRYNFKTREIEAEQFRTGKPPVFAAGEGLRSETTNGLYVATNAFITTDDVAEPVAKVRAKRIKIVPGDRIEARDATLCVGGVPVFYFPYYSRKLDPRANNFNFVPGYRSKFGAYLLNRYTWFLSDELDATAHVDYRVKRGIGAGADFNAHFGPWGEGSLRYYYLHDNDPNEGDAIGIPTNRQRVYFDYQANPLTNLYVKSVMRYQGDTNIIRDFFEGEYRQNPQPDSFLDVNKFWQNFSLDTYAQPRLNDFLETVERLPEVRLTGFRQQLGGSPFYYESESSVGYYRRLFAETNSAPTGRDFEAARAESFHQLLLPYTFFGWLNVTPRVGGRVVYYSEASGPGATTEELYRGVFNTGAEVAFKASRVWPGVQDKLFDVDGLRHIIQPSVNYVYVPRPNYPTNDLPQFDYETPSLVLVPIEFPDYKAIDSIDSQNVLRLGLNNKLQTKREGQVVSLVDWDLFTDWRLRPQHDQSTFSDIYSDLLFKPRSWLTLQSMLRYEIDGGQFRLAFSSITFQPNSVWSWSLGHIYMPDGAFAPGDLGNNLFTSTIYYRLNENYGLRAYHRFEAADGTMQEQAYSIYRDLRLWTAALTFRVLENTTGPTDYTVAFTFSLKAFPRFKLGTDVARSYGLMSN